MKSISKKSRGAGPTTMTVDAILHRKLVSAGLSKKMQGNLMGLYREAVAEAAGEVHQDTRRMDALERLVLNVRLDLRYGSKDLFWTTPEDLDGDTGPSDIRAKMDALIAGRVLETTVEPKDIIRDLSIMLQRLVVAIRNHAPEDSHLKHMGNLAWALLHDRGLSGSITRNTNT